MNKYQVLARKYRPQSFREVLAQEAIVTTLKNAIKMGRLAHAYLFCGSRGTGKTTLARVFAKALNCQSPTPEGEPCNICSTCKEIGQGNSLDVLEIDGASHRGIDDIRQINETVGYASSSGKYKIYIIDEVHMLTKEAFNALLKTLEEPPAKVIFIFATTEPHKVLPTILSRCQRFNLNRIPVGRITEKLRRIAAEQGIDIDDSAIHLLAQRAEGGLRDAESLFDQIIAFHEGKITDEIVSDVLGIMPKETLFTLDKAGKEGRLSAAFDIAHQVFSQGKDMAQFVESLTEHFRTLLLIKLAGTAAPYLNVSEEDRSKYEASAALYTEEQCVTLLDFLVGTQSQIRYQTSGRIALEAILLHIMRSHNRIPVGFLVKRLAELEQAVQGIPTSSPAPSSIPAAEEPLEKPAPKYPTTKEKIEKPVPKSPVTQEKIERPTPKYSATEAQRPEAQRLQEQPKQQPTITIDPTPSPADLGVRAAVPKQAAPKPAAAIPTGQHKQSHYDTLLQFAAVELEGTVQKKHSNPH